MPKYIISGGHKKKLKSITTTETDIICKSCGCDKLVFNGSKNEGVRYLRCIACGKQQTYKLTYPNCQYEKEYIQEALNNFYRGLSFKDLRDNIKEKLRKNNIIRNINKSTVWKWVIKYTKIVIASKEGGSPS